MIKTLYEKKNVLKSHGRCLLMFSQLYEQTHAVCDMIR